MTTNKNSYHVTIKYLESRYWLDNVNFIDLEPMWEGKITLNNRIIFDRQHSSKEFIVSVVDKEINKLKQKTTIKSI